MYARRTYYVLQLHFTEYLKNNATFFRKIFMMMSHPLGRPKKTQCFSTALQTVRKAMTHIYYEVENGWLRLSLWAARAGSSFSTPKSAVTSFPHCL